MVDKDLVLAAYRLLLGREPENNDVISEHSRAPNVSALISGFMSSGEFQQKHPSLKARSNSWVWTDIYEDFSLRVNLSDAHVSWNILEGKFESSETAFVNKFLKPGMQALDIGANLGYFTMLMGSLVGESGHIYSFEPLPMLFSSLQKSVSRSGFQSRVTMHNVALSENSGNALLVYAPNSDNWGGAYLSFDGAVPKDHATELVPIEPLSKLINPNRLDLIKIDVEGAEPIVLGACADLLKKLRPAILTEIHPGQLKLVSGKEPNDYLLQLEALDYQCFKLDSDGSIGDRIKYCEKDKYLNAVFIPK